MKTTKQNLSFKLLITAFFLFSLSYSYAQNLVTDGNFELTNNAVPTSPINEEYLTLNSWNGNALTHWTHSGIVDVHHKSHWNMGSPPNGIDHHIDLNPTGSVSQVLSGLKPGGVYTLTFFTKVHARTFLECSGSQNAGASIIVANLNEQISLNWASSEWIQYSYTFVASSTSETLSFISAGSCYSAGGVLIDDVEVLLKCDPECNDGDWLKENTTYAPKSHLDRAYRIGDAGIGTLNPTWNFKLTVDNTNGTGVPNNSRNAIKAVATHDDCTFGYGVLVETNPLGGTKAVAVQGGGADKSVLFGNGMAWFSNRVTIGGAQPLDVCSDVISDPILVINGSGLINEMSLYSDQRFKKNINPIEDTYSIIQKLNPVSYSYKTSEFADRNFSKTPTYGFIAQEIKEVLPNVVRKEKDGYYSVNYIAVIPVLTQAIKEQQETIKKLEEKVAAIAETKKEKGSFDETPKQKEELNTGAMLFQNNPNPLNNVTFIDYYLPANSSSAFVKVIDNNGKLVKAFPVNQKGYGQLELDCTNLQSGIYYYSLIVDKQVIDTLKMVVAKD